MIHLHTHSWFSFLAGASSPQVLAERAARLGQGVLALTDDWTLAGAVQHARSCQVAGIKPIFGARVEVEGVSLVLLCADAEGYANLCDLLTLAHRTRLDPQLEAEHLRTHAGGLFCLADATPMMRAGQHQAARQVLAWLHEAFGARLFVELVHHRREGDTWVMQQCASLAESLCLPTVASNAVRHAAPRDYALFDALSCARLGLTVAQSHPARPSNDAAFLCPDKYLHSIGIPIEAIANTKAIARECSVDLLAPHVQPPHARLPEDVGAHKYLRRLCREGFYRRFPGGNAHALQVLEKELRVIGRLELDEFFLVVREVVEFARSAGIRCCGRGSAANSLVAYLLGITEVDPIRHNLLFERFLHAGRRGMPDIDVDFETHRRDEVIAWMNRRWGEAHTAMTANVITFRLRLAVREMAKVLGFPLPLIDAAGKVLPSTSARHIGEHKKELAQVLGLDVTAPALQVLVGMVERLHGCPRHLGLHSGGMILSRQPLRHLSPIQTSANGVRQIQFAKDDVESLGLIKFDVLGLRMLSVISEAQEMIRHEQAKEQARNETSRRMRAASPWRSTPAAPPQALGARAPRGMPMRASAFGRGGITVDPSRRIDLPRSVPPLQSFPAVPEDPAALDAPSTCAQEPPRRPKLFDADALPEGDPKTYKLIRSGATLGVFQIESPGQWHLLARSQPENFDDLVAQVALFRPGPLQGNMVHPYVARRRGLAQVMYPHPSLEPVLRDTYGVILFQEQVLEVAHLFAGMSLQEADEFRRLMSRFRDRGEMEAMRDAFVASAIATHAASPHPVAEALAHAVFDLVALFVGYGFCRSHAAAFARTVYQSAYLKAHHPAAYMAAVMEHKPGFYPLQTLLEEARHLGVQVLGPCLHRSSVKYLLEDGKIRVPFSQIKTVSPESAALIVLERALNNFASLEESVARLSFLGREQWENLARSGALQDFGARRDVLWRVRLLLRARPRSEQLQLDLAGQESSVDAPTLPLLKVHERITWDFETQSLTTGAHPLALHRANLKRLGARTIEELREHRDGERVLVAGAVISRQRPPTAKGMSFLILEDETGRLPTAVPPHVWSRSEALRRASALLIEGRLEDGLSGEASTCRTLEGASTYRSVLIERAWVVEEVVS